MVNINQIFYLMFAVFAFGIALNSYIDFKNQKIRSDIKVYWIIAMTLIVLSSLGYTIGSSGLPLFLFFGSSLLTFALITAGFLFRALTKPLTKRVVYGSFGLALGSMLFLGTLLAIKSPYLYRLLTVAFTLFAITIWQIWEVRQARKIDASIHLRFIEYLLYFLLVLIVFRVLTSTDPKYDAVNYLFEESSSALFVRLTLSGSYLILFVFINNYFYDRLLMAERHAMMQLGEKKVELQNTVKENEEIKSLLEERESLIGSLIRSNKTATTGALSASIAHELNQPLGASNLNIQFLKMKLEKGELNSQLQKELFDALQADNNRATDIVRSLRSIFTDEKLEAECTNLTALTESILVIVKPELKAKNIELLIDMPPELKAPVRKTEIQQVTLNLLNNAIQSLDTSNRADKKITIEGERGVDGVKICISDNGVGVAKAIQGDLFTIINSGKKTGMGLGLWLCQHIVGRHGGSIWHEDIPDGGARFCFKLPLSTF